MRTATYAWLIAGLVCCQGISYAGEGSSLRGLKAPRDSVEAVGLSLAADRTEQGLDLHAAALRDDLAPRLTLYTGTRESLHFAAGHAAYTTSLHQAAGLPASAIPHSPFDPRFTGAPRYTLSSQVTQSLPGGWGVGFGLRQTDYGFATGNLLALSAERYFGNVRGAYTLYSNGANGGGFGAAHRFQVNYLYGERNVVGLAYTTGRDIENMNISAVGLPVADSRDVTLSGRHWLSTNWALTYDVVSQEQSLWNKSRQGLRLGVSRSF
ncbi:MAG TPA: YaiO family outer membrane beta-barrel protein [Burkholderiales bacterium]|nr:YaiO family outer membrane beta-barrel protein [Burkholderiales bacterium]